MPTAPTIAMHGHNSAFNTSKTGAMIGAKSTFAASKFVANLFNFYLLIRFEFAAKLPHCDFFVKTS